MLALNGVGIHCSVSTSDITTINQANKPFIRTVLGIELSLPYWKSSAVTEPFQDTVLCWSVSTVQLAKCHTLCSTFTLPAAKPGSHPCVHPGLWPLSCSGTSYPNNVWPLIHQTLANGFQCAGDVKYEWRSNANGYCMQNNVLMFQAGFCILKYFFFF